MTTKPPTQEFECAHCGKVLEDHYHINRYVNGNVKGDGIRVCGTLCLAQWSARYVTFQGARGVALATNAIERLFKRKG